MFGYGWFYQVFGALNPVTSPGQQVVNCNTVERYGLYKTHFIVSQYRQHTCIQHTHLVWEVTVL